MVEQRDRHLAAVVFTDLVGYTALLHGDEAAALKARALHRRALEDVVPRHNGRLLQFMGDGSLSLFPSSVAAVTAALELQDVVSPASPIPMRVGIDEGEVAYDEQGVYGHCVNRAARIEAIAEPGSVYVSEKVLREVENQPAFRAHQVGTFDLKNVDRPVQVYSVRHAAQHTRPVDLRLLGGFSLKLRGEPVSGRSAQRRRMAFLALLAAAPHGVMTRDKVVGYLWPDTDPAKARRLLSEALYVIRKSLGEESVVATGGELRLSDQVVWSDVSAYLEALAEDDLEEAVELYRGPFLDGFYVDDAIEFDRWVETIRDRFARAYADALKNLALQAEGSADAGAAVVWWRKLIELDPLDAAVALGYMEALEAAGRRPEALQFAQKHARFLREEFDAEPNPEVEALAARLRESPGHTTVDLRGAASATAEGRRAPAQPGGTSAGDAGAPSPIAQQRGHSTSDRQPRTTVGRVAALAGAAAAVLVGGGLGLKLLAPVGPSDGDPAADPDQVRVAVWPFAGTEYTFLWEPLSEYLAGGGNVTSVPTSTVRSVRDWVEGGSPGLEVVERLNTKVEATHFVLGSTLVISGKLRVKVDLYEVGNRVALATGLYQEGDSAAALDLVQKLALELLPRLSPNPTLRLAAATATSAAALGAFNEGETAFLDARHNEAIPHFERAVEIDPGYAFGYHRLSQAYEWNEQYIEAWNASDKAMDLSGGLSPRRRGYIVGWNHFLHGRAKSAAAVYENALFIDHNDVEALYGSIKVSLIYNPYLGFPRANAKPRLEQLVDLNPKWGDIRIHLLEFAARDGDLAGFDTIMAGLDRQSKIVRAWELARAMAVGHEGRTLAELGRDIHEVEVFGYAVGQLDTFFGEPELADSLVEYVETRTEWAGTDWMVGARLYSGAFDLAQHQWREGVSEIRKARSQNRAWALEFEALYSGLPGRSDAERVQAASEAHEALLEWTPSPEDESNNPFLAVHTGLNGHLREYLLGLTEIWMDEPEQASEHIRALENESRATTPGRFASELAESLRGHQAYAQGNRDEALRRLEQVDLEPTIPQLVASPFFARPQDRYLMARIHEERGELEEAERWFQSLTDAFDFPYVAAGYLGLFEVAIAKGDSAEARENRDRYRHRLGLSESEADQLIGDVRRAIEALGIAPGRADGVEGADSTSGSGADPDGRR